MQGISYESPTRLTIINQLLLPHKEEYIEIKSVEDTYNVIHSMQVRGAPAIAIVAMLGLSVHLQLNPSDVDQIDVLLHKLSKSRPTAVNLFNAIEDVERISKSSSSLPTDVKKYAEEMYKKDREMCDSIASNGVEWVKSNFNGKITAITICNTGSLATAGCGTALGIIKKLHKENLLTNCYFLETRPYNQGARLTSVELSKDKIPCTMICDSASAFLMKTLTDKKDNVAIFAGADRITDKFVYNKIGTLSLAVLAKYYKIPMVIAAPITTFASTEKSVIEERPACEMMTINGLLENDIVNVKICPDVPVWNPSFDQVDLNLITEVITQDSKFKK